MDFYQRGALLLDHLEQKRGSLKSLATRHSKNGDSKRILALCIETLKYRLAILEILAAAQVERDLASALRGLAVQPGGGGAHSAESSQTPKGKKKEATNANRKMKKPQKYNSADKNKPSLVSLYVVLVHDLLFARRGLQLPKEHRVKKELEKLATRLRAEKERLKIRRKVQSDQDLQTASVTPSETTAADETSEPPCSVRWMRVNSIKWSVKQAVAWLEENGWTQTKVLSDLSSVTNQKAYVIDQHLPMLLAFPRDLELPALMPYRDGQLIAQDKASCLPPYILCSTLGETQVRAADATAAPGNKTSFLSALLQQKETTGSNVVAFEQDKYRFRTLEMMLKTAGCKNVQTKLADFLAQDPQDEAYSSITHLLVDPSCSGSGITTRLDHLSGTAPDADRVRSLARFQTTILSHALRFSAARRVVYSTCSIHEEENEQVVSRVLAKPEFVGRWALAPREEVLPAWSRRSPVNESMIRCLPEDGLHGFFVACLIRVDAEEEEEEWQGIASSSE